MRPVRIALLIAALGAAQAQAGVFDDEEARRQIADHRIKTEARFDQQSRAQLELSAQIQRQADEIARLNGLIETLSYELETAKKRQQDFYLDLDTRLRKFETPAQAAADAPAEGAAPARPAADPARETQEYEAALNQFKAAKYKEAAAGFPLSCRNTRTASWPRTRNTGWVTPGMRSATVRRRSRRRPRSLRATPKAPRRPTPGWRSRPASRNWAMRTRPAVRWKPSSPAIRSPRLPRRPASA